MAVVAAISGGKQISEIDDDDDMGDGSSPPTPAERNVLDRIKNLSLGPFGHCKLKAQGYIDIPILSFILTGIRNCNATIYINTNNKN